MCWFFLYSCNFHFFIKYTLYALCYYYQQTKIIKDKKKNESSQVILSIISEV